MQLLGLGAPVIDPADRRQQQRRARGIGPVVADGQHGDGRQPPEQVLAEIRRMPRPGIRPVGQDAAMRQVGKAQAERHRRPGIDRRQPHQHRARDRQQDRLPREPVRPVAGAGVIIERPALVHQDEGRVADQRRHPPARIGRRAADVRIEEAKGQDVADRRERHVDHEHEGDEPVGQRHRVRQHVGSVAADEIAEPRRHDRQHEGEEERLHPPGPQVALDRLHGIGFARMQRPCAQRPRPSRGSTRRRSIHRT